MNHSHNLLTSLIFCALSAHTFALNDLKEINPEWNRSSVETIHDSTQEALDVITESVNKTELAPIQRSTKQQHHHRPQIAIIIDDIGYNYTQGIKAIDLPGEITYAIIPHSPKAHFFAVEAQKRNKEIMLHAPMSTIHNTPLGTYGLTETMSEVTFKEALTASLDSLPGVSGVNNHMGSLLTQKTLPMEWVMQSLQERQLYFIDSRTSSDSIAWEIAQNLNIPSLKRDIFLDHQPNTEFIHRQFLLLKGLAKRQGYAVAIGHPYQETIRYLQKNLHLLKQEGIELVSASTLVQRHSPNKMSPKSSLNVIQFTKQPIKSSNF